MGTTGTTLGAAALLLGIALVSFGLSRQGSLRTCDKSAKSQPDEGEGRGNPARSTLDDKGVWPGLKRIVVYHVGGDWTLRDQYEF